MNTSDQIEVVDIAKSRALSHEVSKKHPTEVVFDEASIKPASVSHNLLVSLADGSLQQEHPNEEDSRPLRRVPGKVSWITYTVAFVELCERFSYYGTTAVFVTFIQRPLPAHSTTGALVTGTDFNEHVPGALGMGQRTSAALTLLALVGDAILVISAVPRVIGTPGGAIACFSIGLVVMGVGTGGFKCNKSPLIAEQYREDKPYIRVLSSGERIILDSAATISRIFLYFYLMINVGSLLGQVGMVYAERYVGFWLSFLLPTVKFCPCPTVMFLCRNYYYRAPPSGSVYSRAFCLWRLAMKGRWSLNPMKLLQSRTTPSDFWDRVKPSRLGPEKPPWMIFDDPWVYEVRRGFEACAVFLWYPLYWLAYNQAMNSLTSQVATMSLGGVPNDVIGNLNPITLIILLPIRTASSIPPFVAWDTILLR
ncbi:hypothetical protein N7451_000031 [Penicillium sp. IBT 35674x]|nr:hypothetical protein N7451_000031 [Penicillium sp. IBT 35674x]